MMMPFGARGRGDLSGLHFPENFSSWNGSCERAGKGRWHLRASVCPRLLGGWMACLAMATPEVSHLPAGVGCYFGQVKY